MSPVTAAPYDLVVRADRAVVGGRVRPAAVAVTAGRIAAVGPVDVAWSAQEEVRLAEDEALLPGLVDSHVHVNEPGRTHWEGFASATAAAAAGGVTTLVDMPLNSVPPTTDVAALRIKQEAARDQVVVDVAFWGGAVPGNVGALAPLHAAGVAGFKCFLVDSGVPEFPPLDRRELREHLAEVARLGALMVVHAEDPGHVGVPPPGASYAEFLRSRPPAAEEAALTDLVAAARETGARVHVLHLADGAALPVLRRARASGVDLTVETCPHYLTFTAETVPERDTLFKCCPPIRGAAHREALWGALASGDVDLVVSDHSPSDAAAKALGSGDLAAAWGGIASLQVSLPAVWSGARERGHDLADVVRWMAQAPAALAGLPGKGALASGYDADLVVLAPEQTWRVEAAALQHRHPLTPYDGLTLTGAVRATWLRGRPVGGGTRGRLLRRGTR